MASIGKYEIQGKVGQGGMGVVYVARDPIIERDVAIKVIRETFLESPDIKRRFYREARSAGGLSHENIVTIYDVGEDDGNPFIVMELLDGINLRTAIDEELIPALADKLDIAIQICRGVEYAHWHSIIHRDIKPGNVQVLNDGRVKLLDFGIARLESDTSNLTQSSLGTPRYMAPEQVRGEPVDQRIDIFSFGVLFYELLTGINPFFGERVTEVMYKILHVDPKPLDIESGPLTGDLQRITSKCVAKDRDERYSTFGEVIGDLEQIIARSGEKPHASARQPAASSLETTPLAPRPRRSTILSELGLPSGSTGPTELQSPSESVEPIAPPTPLVPNDPPTRSPGPHDTAAQKTKEPATPPSRHSIPKPALIGLGLALGALVVAFVVWTGSRSSNESALSGDAKGPSAEPGRLVEQPLEPPPSASLARAVAAAREKAASAHDREASLDDALFRGQVAAADSLLAQGATSEEDGRYEEAIEKYEQSAARYGEVTDLRRRRTKPEPGGKAAADQLRKGVESRRASLKTTATTSSCIRQTYEEASGKSSRAGQLYAAGDFLAAATAYEEAKDLFDEVSQKHSDMEEALSAETSVESAAASVVFRRTETTLSEEFEKVDALLDDAKKDLNACMFVRAMRTFEMALEQYRRIGSLPEVEESLTEIVEAASVRALERLEAAMRHGEWSGIEAPVAATYRKYHTQFSQKSEILEVAIQHQINDGVPIVMLVSMTITFREQGKAQSENFQIQSIWDWTVEQGQARVSRIEAH